MQLTWLPALPIYTQFGVEALQGDNSLIANQLSEQYPDLLDETPGPRLFTGFVKVSPDLGYSNTLQGGVSGGRSRSHQEAETSGPRAGVYDGTSWFFGTDWIWRRDSAQSYGEGDLSVQGEDVYRSKALEPGGIPQRAEFVSRQDGLYVQAVYGIAPDGLSRDGSTRPTIAIAPGV